MKNYVRNILIVLLYSIIAHRCIGTLIRTIFEIHNPDQLSLFEDELVFE